MESKDLFLSTLQTWMETAMHRSIHAFIRRNRETALSLSQVSTLFRLYHHGPSSVNELAEHLGISVPAVSQLLDNLVNSGLILRTEDPTDRRAKLIALTDKGALTVEESMHARHAWLEDLANQFTAAEKETLLPMLHLLNQRTQVLLQESKQNCTHPHGHSSKHTPVSED